jgi:hypothetical protein
MRNLIGSWDIAYRGLAYSLNIALHLFKQGLLHIKSTLKKHPTEIDLRILGTTPMVDNWFTNNFVIRLFNKAMKHMVEQLEIDYIDVFAMEYPCKDNLAKFSNNQNHYFSRDGNEFKGSVGKAVYFGILFPSICP